MISAIITYLREMVETCISVACACPHRTTARELEEIAAGLMAKAKELEDLQLA